MEVVDYLFLRGVVGVAFRIQGGDAGSVLFPLVLPEGFVITLVVLPVFSESACPVLVKQLPIAKYSRCGTQVENACCSLNMSCDSTDALRRKEILREYVQVFM